MGTKALLFLVLFCAMSCYAIAKPTEHVVWDKTPIAIILPLNQERLIQFPGAISVVDSELDEDIGMLKVQDTLYLDAQQPFTNKRLVVKLMPDGDNIILNVSANKESTNVTPIEILMDESDADDVGDSEEADDPSDEKAAQNPDLNPVSLTRFAIQSLYSPERLLVTPPGVIRTPMRTHKTLTMVYGASILARPLISWRGGDLYVTAIELKNQLNKTVIVDPHHLMGNWQTATFFPTNTLGARGSADTSTVFVVSDRPFGDAFAQTQEFVR